jgi:hypothetical protein
MLFMTRVLLFAVSLLARISDLASARTLWAATGAWMLLGAASRCGALPGLVPMLDGVANAGIALEEQKPPMHFSWVACEQGRSGALKKPVGRSEIKLSLRMRDLGVARIGYLGSAFPWLESY